MAFLVVPLTVLVVSTVLIVWIVSRKFVYLRKLEPGAVQTVFEGNGKSSFWVEMFPEMAAYFSKSKLQTFRVNFLTEFERLLRQLRLISRQIDDLTNRLIKSVRSTTKKHEEILNKEVKLQDEKIAELDNGDLLSELGGTGEELKQKEQLLIIEIAKNPKDPKLYKDLGTLYMKTGEWADARQSLEKAIELDPSDETAKRKLGRVRSKLRQA